ncbi:MAG: tyrosine-protein phosphatase [Pseudomonadales bacterium]|nr:tyrosine-protein phosphatase [Pseudomonadales bacterium]
MLGTRILPIEGSINFRDMGGYRTREGRTLKWKRVFRSGQLSGLTETGVREMRSIGIETVFDLRSKTERDIFPTDQNKLDLADLVEWKTDELPDQFKNALGWKESIATLDAKIVRKCMKDNYPVKLYSHKSIYREMLVTISKGDAPLLFHCAAGKDRTGVGAAIILGLLGVDEETIVSDYLITQGQLGDKLESWAAGGAVLDDSYLGFQKVMSVAPFEVVQPVFEANVSYIQCLLDYVQQHFGSFEAYVKEVLKIDDDLINRLKTQMLEAG